MLLQMVRFHPLFKVDMKASFIQEAIE